MANGCGQYALELKACAAVEQFWCCPLPPQASLRWKGCGECTRPLEGHQRASLCWDHTNAKAVHQVLN